jgi:hypothetical protein
MRVRRTLGAPRSVTVPRSDAAAEARERGNPNVIERATTTLRWPL